MKSRKRQTHLLSVLVSKDGSVFLQFIIRDHDYLACTFGWYFLQTWLRLTQPWCDMFKSIYFCSQAGRKIAHTPYLRLFQSSFNIEARSSCIFQDSGWIFALLHRVGCNTAVILHMFEGCEWLAGGTSREEGSGAHFCATLWSITTAGILLARRQHLQTDFSAQSLLPPVQSFLRVINWNSFCFEEKKLILLVERFSLLPRNRIGRWNPMSKTCSGQAHKWCST